ncbi:hypothetical protein VNO77_22305 [Canavalia gladiata]|uniref:Uncharacterized protein n=1 Tax=Canavalia gladiata TaxID=3824 RepID=A0AAN9QEC2_CANGL
MYPSILTLLASGLLVFLLITLIHPCNHQRSTKKFKKSQLHTKGIEREKAIKVENALGLGVPKEENLSPNFNSTKICWLRLCWYIKNFQALSRGRSGGRFNEGLECFNSVPTILVLLVLPFIEPVQNSPVNSTQSQSPVLVPLAVSTPPPIHNTYPMVTRAKFGIHKPKLFIASLETSSTLAVLAIPHWKQVVDDEYDALIGNKTRELVSLPPNRKSIGSK